MRARPAPLLALGLVVVAIAAVAIAVTRQTADASDPRPVAAALRCATPRHPNPVVLVPGTFEATSWTAIAGTLAADGYCVKSFQYPSAGTGPIAQSASDLGAFVDRVLRSTHATHVSIVAHSEGGVVARYY